MVDKRSTEWALKTRSLPARTLSAARPKPNSSPRSSSTRSCCPRSNPTRSSSPRSSPGSSLRSSPGSSLMASPMPDPAFPQCRLRSRRSCFPPEHYVVEVPAALLRDQRHRDPAGGFPDAPALLRRALALAVLVVVHQQNEPLDTGQHGKTPEPAARDRRPCRYQRGVLERDARGRREHGLDPFADHESVAPVHRPE